MELDIRISQAVGVHGFQSLVVKTHTHTRVKGDVIIPSNILHMRQGHRVTGSAAGRRILGQFRLCAAFGCFMPVLSSRGHIINIM